MQNTIIEVVYGNSMSINKGNYEAEKPFFSAKTIIEVDDPTEIDNTYNAEYSRLRGIIDPMIAECWRNAKPVPEGVRIREKDGKKYPSVTSILNPDGIPIDPVKLKNHCDYGNDVDELFKEYFAAGGSRAPRKLKSSYDGLADSFDPLKMISLIDQSGIEIKQIKSSVEIFSEDHLYSGEIDCLVPYEKSFMVLDIKTGSYKWEQLVAYAKAINEGRYDETCGVKYLGILDCKGKKFIIKELSEMVKEWERFLILRGAFKSRFSL